MRNNVIASLIIGFCILFVMQTAFADEFIMPKDVIKINVAIQKIQAQGYKNIREIKFKNGFYEAEVFTAEGNKLEVRVNTKTGDVEKLKKEPKLLSMLEIIKKVQAAGYRDIHKISFDDGEYEVTAISKDGIDTKLELKAETGEISKSWF